MDIIVESGPDTQKDNCVEIYTAEDTHLLSKRANGVQTVVL